MKIMLAVDRSVVSDRAVRFVARHWNAVGEGTPVTLLHVDAPLLPQVEKALGTTATARYYADNAEFVLGPARRRLARAKVPTIEVVILGDPATLIVRRSRGGRFDLIVLGSRGRGALKSVFLGSTAIKVLAQSAVPVLVVR